MFVFFFVNLIYLFTSFLRSESRDIYFPKFFKLTLEVYYLNGMFVEINVLNFFI